MAQNSPMSAGKTETATRFIRSLSAGDAALATKQVDQDRYVEHDPRVADGAAGLREHIDGLSKKRRGLAVIRTLEDGAWVVVQTQGGAPDRNDSFDVFRFDVGLIVEHWAFSARSGPPNKSGHTQADGPTAPRHLEETEKNKAVVRDYYETVHIAGKHDQARRWFTGDLCIRHEPGVVDGVAAFLKDLEVLTRDRTIDEIKVLAGEGDFVFLVARGTVDGDPCAYVDLYKVEGGKLVEHWGFPEPFPPPQERKNDNGMV